MYALAGGQNKGKGVQCNSDGMEEVTSRFKGDV